MCGVLALALTELLQLQLRCAFRHADTRAVIPLTALFALKPDIFSFALLLGHKPAPAARVRPFYEFSLSSQTSNANHLLGTTTVTSAPFNHYSPMFIQ